LDESKVHMLRFWYNYLQPKFAAYEAILLNYIDTDGIVISIVGCADVFAELRNDIPLWFDTSEMDEKLLKLFRFEKCNKKAVGFFKFENSGKLITEFVGLSCKNYILSFKEEEEDKISKIVKMKGVSKNIVKDLEIKDFRTALIGESKRNFVMYRIEHKRHLLSTLKVVKSGFNIDDKRIPILNSPFYSTYAIGHIISRDEERME
jgi:hypothetical protein